eukprot:m.193271 g.193271  ORF g.193271 m.193271 type:complete len:927 (-) comp32498_c1_seq5:147-2927(-)
MSDQLLANTQQALNILYHDRDTDRQKEADNWLKQLTQAPEAWDLSWALLQQPNCATEVQLYAISLMRASVISRFSTLSEEQVEQLKKQLFEFVATTARTGNKLMLNKASAVLTHFAIQAIPTSWSGTMGDIIQMFTVHAEAIGGENAQKGLLEFAKVFAEEIRSSLTKGPRRAQLTGEITAATPQILGLLHTVLAADPNVCTISALQCLEAWVEAPGGPTLDQLQQHLALMLRLIEVDAVRETMGDTLIAMLKQGQSERFPETIRALVPYFLSWRDYYRAAVRDGDDQTAADMGRLILSLGDTHIQMLLDSQTEEQLEHVKALLSFILEMFDNPKPYPTGETLSNSTHYFWNLFLDEMQDPRGDDRNYDIFRARYGSMFLPLLQACHRKLQYPPDSEPLDKEDLSVFRDYRTEVTDTIATLCLMMKEHCQAALVQILETSLTAQPLQWQSIEASLYALRGSAETVHDSEATYTPKLFTLLNAIPQHQKTLQAALLVVGSYSEWLCINPASLTHAVPFMLQALSIPELAKHAAVAVGDVCRDCATHLVPWIDAIFESCLASMQNMGQKDRLKVTSALCSVINNLPAERNLAENNRLFGPHVNAIIALVNDSTKANEIKNHLKFLMIACDQIRPLHALPELLHPVVALLKNAWPAFRSIFNNWNGNEDVIRLACDCLSQACSSIESLFSVFLDDLIGTEQAQGWIIISFVASPNVRLIKLTQTIVGMFIKESASEACIYRLILQMSEQIFALFKVALREHPDVAKDYFDMMKIVIRRRADLVFSNLELSQLLMQAAIFALQCPEHPTFTSTCVLISVICEAAKKHEIACQTVIAQGPNLIDTLLRGVGGEFDRSLVGNVSKVWMMLRQKLQPQVVAWATPLLAQEGYPNANAKVDAKQNFLQQIQLGPKSNTLTVMDRILQQFADSFR